jgi:hypothetical protein
MREPFQALQMGHRLTWLEHSLEIRMQMLVQRQVQRQ